MRPQRPHPEQNKGSGGSRGEFSDKLLVGRLLRKNGSTTAESWLRDALYKYPVDFWLNLEMGLALESKNPQQAVGYYRAAAAIRPDNSLAWNNLGYALYASKQYDEAISVLQEAVRLDKKYASAHSNLGLAFGKQENHELAIKQCQEAVRLEPSAFYYCRLGDAFARKLDHVAAIVTYRKAIRLEPNHASAHFSLAYALHDQHELDAAKELYLTTILLDAKHASAHNNLANILRSQGKLDKAITYYHNAIKLKPAEALYYNNLGNTLTDQGKSQEAIKKFQEAVKLDPSYATAHRNLGWALYKASDLDGAIRHYTKALELQPNHAWTHDNLGDALYDKGDRDAATKQYQQAVKLNPYSTHALNNLGIVCREKGDLIGAFIYLTRVMDLNPKYFWAYSNLAKALDEIDDWDGAAFYYSKAIDINRHSADSHNRLGVMLRKKKDLLKAWWHCASAVQLRPKSAYYHLDLGVLYDDLEKPAGAIAHYKKAIALESNYGLAHYNLARSFVKAPAAADAVPHFLKAIDLMPNDPEPLYELGGLLQKLGDQDGAMRHYSKAIALEPKHAWAHNNLGNIFRDQLKFDKAIPHYLAALKVDPKDYLYHHNLGRALVGKKDLAGAIEHFAQATKSHPTYAEGFRGLGWALLQKGEFAAAKEAITSCLKLIPANHAWCEWLRLDQQNCDTYLALERKLEDILNNRGMEKEAEEIAKIAYFSQQYKARYVKSVQLYEAAFAADPKLEDATNSFHRFNAACGAVMASTGKGKDAADLDGAGKEKLREKALAWLKAELGALASVIKGGDFQTTCFVARALAHWQMDADLASVRDEQYLAKLEPAEAKDWHKLWGDVGELLKQADTQFTETSIQGHLTGKEKQQVHQFPLKKGMSYVIEMRSKDFDCYLRVADSIGKTLFENDNVSFPDDLNSRIDFTAPADSTYRIITSSFEQQGVGAYTLIIRAWVGGDKQSLIANGELHPLAHFKGALSGTHKTREHEVKLKAGRTYLFEMESQQLDTFLWLEDPFGQLLTKAGENGGNQHAQFTFTAKEAGTYRLVATSFQLQGVGAYTLTVREFIGKKKLQK